MPASPHAGWNVAVYGGGSPITMTAEACSLVSGNTYRITDIEKRFIDPETAVLVYENAILTVQSYVIDNLAGTITFAGAATTPVTITGKFIPRGKLVCAREAEITEERVNLDRTCFKLDGETDAGVMLSQLGLKDATGSISHIELLVDQIDTSGTGAGVDARLIDALFRNALDYTILEIQFGTTWVWRGFVVFTSAARSVSVEDLVKETLTWELAANAGGTYTEFAYVA